MTEPLAEDPSSDGEDTPTGVEELAAPAVTAALCLLERLQTIRVVFSSEPPSRTYLVALGLETWNVGSVGGVWYSVYDGRQWCVVSWVLSLLMRRVLTREPVTSWTTLYGS